MSKAILFAVAGTSCPQAADAFRNIERLTRARFPDVTIHWTYTSGGVRRKLSARGAPVDEPAAAFDRLREQGVTRLVVHSLHMAAGTEYGELRDAVERCNETGGFERCRLGPPILETPGLFPSILHELMREIPLPAGGDSAILLVAHGSRSPGARQAFEDAAARCRGAEARILFGTLVAPLELDTVIEDCRKTALKRVFLVPFTVVAGASAVNDIAGPDPASWQSRLEKEGIDCASVLRGLGDYDGIVRLWVEQVGELLGQV